MPSANVVQTSVSGGQQNALALQGDGVFLPKLSTATRTALTLGTSDKGFLAYDTTDNNVYIWNGAAWESVPASGDSANTQVIFNDNGILAGDAGLTYDKATDSLTISGDLTVDTSTLKVTASTDTVTVGATTTDAKFRVVDANYNGLRIGFFPGTLNYNLYDATVHEFRTASVTPQQLYTLQASSSVWYDGLGGTRMTLNANGLGIGVTPTSTHNLSSAGPIGISGTNSGTRTSYISNSGACAIYYTDGGGSGFFTDFGNLIIQPRTSAARSVVIATGSTTPVERAVVKSTGQVRFVPLASDPAGAEAGDVYYNSTSNKLKCYNGTTWNDLF